mmetsp:Transcript_10541/g.30420  ORF Transcript_10541/g.30420 Transcript_10541/m.30420 type:complete len:275 (+) Transcript_10541:95-919(+)
MQHHHTHKNRRRLVWRPKNPQPHQQQQQQQQPQQQQQQQQEQEEQQNPVTYLCVGRRSFFLLSLDDIMRLRSTSRWLRALFKAAQLRQRLSHALSTKAGLRRVVNGQTTVEFLRFDEQEMGVADLLAAMCVVDAGGWGKMGKAIELAGQCGCCQLPLTVTPADLNQYANKTAFLADARVLAHHKIVGRHINVGGKTLEWFRESMVVDPPLRYNPHQQQDDPPAMINMTYRPGYRWVEMHGCGISSLSSSVTDIVLIVWFPNLSTILKSTERETL